MQQGLGNGDTEYLFFTRSYRSVNLEIVYVTRGSPAAGTLSHTRWHSSCLYCHHLPLSGLQSECLTPALIISLRRGAGGALPWLRTFDEGYTASRAGQSWNVQEPLHSGARSLWLQPPFPASLPATPWQPLSQPHA